jgi:hypothetical protein
MINHNLAPLAFYVVVVASYYYKKNHLPSILALSTFGAGCNLDAASTHWGTP